MPLMYKPSKHAKFFDPKEGVTEQEHKDSCDINKMIKAVNNGQMVRQANMGPWFDNPDGTPGAFDDTNLDGLHHRIRRQRMIDQVILDIKSGPMDQEAFNQLPEKVQQLYLQHGVKLKRAEPNLGKKGEKTNDQTNKKTPKKQAEHQPPDVNTQEDEVD